MACSIGQDSLYLLTEAAERYVSLAGLESEALGLTEAIKHAREALGDYPDGLLGLNRKEAARLLAEKPWATPRKGDIAQTADGKQYRRVERFETVLGRSLDSYDSSGSNIVYAGQFGERSCYSTTWEQWCAKAAREGGHYRRAEEEGR